MRTLPGAHTGLTSSTTLNTTQQKNVWLSTPTHSRGVSELDALFGYAHLMT